MMEALGQGSIRIKFVARRGGCIRIADELQPLVQLAALMQRLEACGMVPVLDDGLVGGNCGMVAAAAGLEPAAITARCESSTSSSGSTSTALPGGGTASGSSCLGILVSCSGKQPHKALEGRDWVLLTSFDLQQWQAEYCAAAGGSARPTSDSPLHASALGLGLGRDPAQRWGWAEAPLVVVHGHALAEGAGLERARQAGFPISEQETLFSTPADLATLEALFERYPYPRYRCYIRRGHGFLLLGSSVAEVERFFEQHILPLADGCNS